MQHNVRVSSHIQVNSYLNAKISFLGGVYYKLPCIGLYIYTPYRFKLGWACDGVQHQRIFNRAILLAESKIMNPRSLHQGFGTKACKQWSVRDVASFSHHILVVFSKENTPLSLKNKSLSLGPTLSLKVRSIKRCIGPKVSWIRICEPNVNPPYVTQ